MSASWDSEVSPHPMANVMELCWDSGLLDYVQSRRHQQTSTHLGTMNPASRKIQHTCTRMCGRVCACWRGRFGNYGCLKLVSGHLLPKVLKHVGAGCVCKIKLCSLRSRDHDRMPFLLQRLASRTVGWPSGPCPKWYGMHSSGLQPKFSAMCLHCLALWMN